MRLKNKILVLLHIVFLTVNVNAWEKEEHQRLADMVFNSTLSYCGIKYNDSLIYFPSRDGTTAVNKILWNNLSFGNISSFISGDDISQSHCHLKARTILEQLAQLSKEYIDVVWNRIKKYPSEITEVEASNESAVFNYLLYHLIAMRFAEKAAEATDDINESLRYALTYEAAAQSYLSDTFSSGHMLMEVSDFLAPLNSLNIQISHDYYCSEGVYVINSRGECWQAFGDKLLEWYPYPFSRVLEACTTSLCEIFFVYFAALKNVMIPEQLSNWVRTISPDNNNTVEEICRSWMVTNDGIKYYSVIKLPALLFIPMPVTAVWSIRTNMKDKYGIHYRKNYPQLLEDKFHDPDLNEIDTGFLYPKNSVPHWMIPDFLPNDSLQNLLRNRQDIASVRYIQDRYLPPSYLGYLLSAGGSYEIVNGETKPAASIGFGWGFSDDFLFFLNKPALFITVTKLFANEREWILTTDLGFAINTPLFGFVTPHIEIGYAWKLQAVGNDNGSKYAIGIDSETIPLSFTYAGLTVRLKYQFIFLNKTLHSPMLEIILH